MLLILFGTPGVGKNYVGRVLSEVFKFYFYDADADLTPNMRAAIHQGHLFTDVMRDHFYNDIVPEKISELQKTHRHIAVAQALAKEHNRIQIQQKYPEAKFVFINAETDLINKRLMRRKDWVSLEFAEKVRQAFETPQLEHTCLYNNDGIQEIISQLNTILRV